MTTAYVMGRTTEEYERLRVQARIWQTATEALLDRIDLASGACCLDVGCGPGETMRLMAERVGPNGRVVGLDVDADLGRAALGALRAAGHDQCTYVEGDVERTEALPGRRFDLVYGRLILLHVADPIAALRRMWRWTAPGGHLVIQDYDMSGADVDPPLPVVDEWKRVFFGTYAAAGRPIRLGMWLPRTFRRGGDWRAGRHRCRRATGAAGHGGRDARRPVSEHRTRRDQLRPAHRAATRRVVRRHGDRDARTR